MIWGGSTIYYLRIQGTRQNWNRHLTSSLPKQEQARTGFSKISTYGAFRRGSCWDFELISSSLHSSPYKEECRKINTSYANNTTRKSILLFFSLFWTILHDRYIRTYSHTNSYNNAVTQCHVDVSQRSLRYLCVNATLTVAWILAVRPDKKILQFSILKPDDEHPHPFLPANSHPKIDSRLLRSCPKENVMKLMHQSTESPVPRPPRHSGDLTHFQQFIGLGDGGFNKIMSVNRGRGAAIQQHERSR